MPRVIRCVLIECDPSIKSIIVNIDSDRHDYIIEDLDEQHLVVQENKVESLKTRLDERLKETVPDIEGDSDSDREANHAGR